MTYQLIPISDAQGVVLLVHAYGRKTSKPCSDWKREKKNLKYPKLYKKEEEREISF